MKDRTILAASTLCAVLGIAIPLVAETETVGEYTWMYRIVGDTVEIINNDYVTYAVSPEPVGELSIPSTLGGKPVTSIGDSAFSWCSELTKVVMPNSVTNIGDFAFEYCSSLVDVTMPKGIADIGDFAFRYCCSLARITIPDGVAGIGNAAFFGCDELAEVKIGNGVVSIGTDAFGSCVSLTSIVIPKGVTSIEDFAFVGCTGLTNIFFMGDAPETGDDCFSEVGVDFDFSWDSMCTVFVSENSIGWGVDIPGVWNGMRIEYCREVSVDVGGGKMIAVPESWLEMHKSMVRDNGGDVQAALASKAANGRLTVAECYALDLDPEDATNDFRVVSFPMKADGTPDVANIKFEPAESKWNVQGARAVLKGAEILGDENWQTVYDMSDVDRAKLHYFKYVIELP